MCLRTDFGPSPKLPDQDDAAVRLEHVTCCQGYRKVIGIQIAIAVRKACGGGCSGLATSGPQSHSRLEDNVSPVIIRTRLSRTLGCQTIVIADVADISHQSPRNVLQSGKAVTLALVPDIDELYMAHVQGGGSLSTVTRTGLSVPVPWGKGHDQGNGAPQFLALLHHPLLFEHLGAAILRCQFTALDFYMEFKFVKVDPKEGDNDGTPRTEYKMMTHHRDATQLCCHCLLRQ